jgi:hypothetical protein
VDDAVLVAQEVERLRRAPHHAEHQLAVDEVRLDRADPRPAVPAQRPEQAQLTYSEPLLTERRELRAGRSELVPAHHRDGNG